MSPLKEMESEEVDIWTCPKCGQTVTAPKIRTYDPNTICKHNVLTEDEVWHQMVKING